VAKTRVYKRRHPERTDYYRMSSHVHALVPAGILKDGVFHELENISAPLIADLFRAGLLKVLLDEGVISQQMV